MGHGDEIAVVDANFTAASLANGKPVIRLAGVDLPSVCAAILLVFPLDTDVAQPVAFMHVSHSANDFISPIQAAVIEHVPEPTRCVAVERFAFYERVKFYI